MDCILEVQNLVKSFGSILAVNNISFQVTRGSCFGLLGPNGAGKSTTIEMIERVRKPDSGEILFNGASINENICFFEKLGVQFQQTSLPPHLTVREAVDTFRQLYTDAMPIDEIMVLCQLEKFQHQRHERVSGGQRQRILLAMALVNNPDLVLLDEPTTGLDPQARRHVWDIVREIRNNGKTVILTTHYMDEAYELCDEIGIIDHGKIIALGSPHSLLEEYCRSVVIKFPKMFEKNLPFLEGVINENHIFVREEGVEIHTENLDKIMKYLAKRDLDFSGMNIRQSNLEDLFLKLTGKELRN